MLTLTVDSGYLSEASQYHLKLAFRMSISTGSFVLPAPKPAPALEISY
jgi:hypothetical protein